MASSSEAALTSDRAAGQPRVRRRRVAYIMSRFPKLTETFILCEMTAMQRLGVEVSVFPLWRVRVKTTHREAVPFIEQAHFVRSLSAKVAWANWHFLCRKPRAYVRALVDALRGTWGSRRYFLGALAIFPKVAYFARSMEQAGIDHVHAHFASHPALAAFIIRRLVGIPYSFTAHGSDLHVDRQMLGSKIAEAAFVVAISRYNREIMAAECDESNRHKLRVIHCGVDPKLFQPVPPAPKSLPASLSVACIGTLYEVKGQRYLIEACGLLARDGYGVDLHLIGDGPDSEMLRRRVGQAGLRDQVTFHGAMTRRHVAELLRRTDVVAAPSVPTREGRREGIPVALMEAMSCGLPVVASRISGIPELVEDGTNGLLVPPGDPAALAAALRRLYVDQPFRHRLGEAARFTVLREFDLFKNAEALAELFGGTASPHPDTHQVVPFPDVRASRVTVTALHQRPGRERLR